MSELSGCSFYLGDCTARVDCIWLSKPITVIFEMYVHFHSKCQVFIKMYISADCVLFRKRNKTNILHQTSFGSALRT